MNENQLSAYIKEFGIARDQILREEVEMEILSELSKDKLSAKLVFYGGTALRLVYGSPRFSEDIDLLVMKKVGFVEFKSFAASLVNNNTNWTLKDLKDKRQTMFALISIRDEKLKHAFSVKIEAHKPQRKPKLETELALIKSSLSIAEPLLLVPTLKELQRLKESALAGRKKGRDIFDLWYIAKALRENFILPKDLPKYGKKEFQNELQVFLPKKYYPVIKQLYEQLRAKIK
ncbi:MAG: nucleotidyl transferase AbiEii/AbiGii toxin family protein [Candidatus Moranbacteria bacterium]|nr:nucleotidyl transferase AbiEii/AbiGii toxin family protein [Candidatus Moranbacteria bacterium]